MPKIAKREAVDFSVAGVAFLTYPRPVVCRIDIGIRTSIEL
jgi:hypothetical protein